jgi:hypothetical protein
MALRFTIMIAQIASVASGTIKATGGAEFT